MKSFSETVYLSSPLMVQMLMVNLKGLALERIRHGGSYRDFLRQVLAHDQWQLVDFSVFQLRELKKIITLASQQVPYYRNLFKEIGFCPSDVQCLEDIRKLPLLEKVPIRRNPLAFVDESLNRKDLLILHTTGTTGTPLKIYTNKTARQLNYAFFDAFLVLLGVDLNKKRATIGGRIICHPKQKKPPFWRSSYFQHNLLFSSYHLTKENLPYYVKKLAAYQPEVIDSYPSSLYSIAMHMIGNNQIGLIKPKAIISSAATLFDEQREVIEEAFQCRVSDQYGAAEMCIIAGQCPEGNYHYRPDYSLVEVIKDNQSVKPGEIGEIVCTGLINPVMPLIRYRIGDLGTLGEGPCPCGEKTPFFSKIVGRIDDVIITPDGRYVGRLSPVLKGFPVKESQYVQVQIDEITVNLVPDDSFNQDTPQHIIKEVQKRLGYDILVKLEIVDHLERGPGGKLKTIISKIPDRIKFNDPRQRIK